MGEIHLAVEKALNRKVAIKYLSEELQQNLAAVQRFQEEARAAASIDHPFIGKIYRWGELDGKPFIAMEFVEGQTLQARLAEEPLPLPMAIRLAGEIAEALAEAHRHGIVHRDLKPANIMLTPQGHVKVLDFGLAKRLFQPEEEKTWADFASTGGQILGTVAYMSPEQARAELVDTRADLFSLGIVFYEMFSGVNPFLRKAAFETIAAILHEEPRPLGEQLAGCPADLEVLVGKLLEKLPIRRYQSCLEVCERFRLL